jgi:hypothetical protein
MKVAERRKGGAVKSPGKTGMESRMKAPHRTGKGMHDAKRGVNTAIHLISPFLAV